MRKAMPVRFRILTVLFFLSLINYVVRNNISIALPSIQSEFHLSAQDVGWILWAFNFSYTLFQIPGGMFGELLGVRKALTIISIAWAVLTVFTGLAPQLVIGSAMGAIASLMVVRFLMGVSHAPIFPVSAASFVDWFPPGSWAFPNSIINAGLTLGQAILGPIVATLITYFGWRESFYIVSPLSLIGAWVWWSYARDTPREHKAVTPEELAYIEAGRPPARPLGQRAPNLRRDLRAAFANRDLLLLTAAYFCENYVFYMFAQWLFVYLVEQRGFSFLQSGWLYAMPFATGALLALVGGKFCDAMCQRLGPAWGCRLTGIIGMSSVGIFQIAGVYAVNPYVAVVLLSLCFGFTQFTEGAFWSAATYAGEKEAPVAIGLLNTGGNAAGFLAPVVGMMIDHWGWVVTLLSGSVFAFLSVIFCSLVRLRDATQRAAIQTT